MSSGRKILSAVEIRKSFKSPGGGLTEVLKGAELRIETIPAVTLCENCTHTYPTVPQGRVCPLCGSEETVLLQGNEINLKEIEAC